MLPNEGHCLRAKVRLSPLHVMVANHYISITYKGEGMDWQNLSER